MLSKLLWKTWQGVTHGLAATNQSLSVDTLEPKLSSVRRGAGIYRDHGDQWQSLHVLAVLFIDGSCQV